MSRFLSAPPTVEVGLSKLDGQYWVVEMRVRKPEFGLPGSFCREKSSEQEKSCKRVVKELQKRVTEQIVG